VNQDQVRSGPGAFVRRAVSSDRAFVASIALCWIVRQISGYPLDYLTRLDPEIWWIQIGTWLVFVAEGIAIGVAAVVAAHAVRRLFEAAPSPPFAAASGALLRGLRSPKAPLVAGCLTAAAAAWVWGLHPVPVVHDEAAYLLQAKLFATARWKAAAAPLPEFFEQMYAFRTPFTAAKYFPGFSAVLVPGIWIGIPALVPIVLSGLSGGLLFALARSIAGETAAALAWTIWTTTPHAVWSMPPFMSQHLTTTLMLLAWWSLLRWREHGRAGSLLLVAAALGLGAITRPLTMLVAAVPIGVVVVGRVASTRRWGQLFAAAALGGALLAVVPLWSLETTGNWRTTPLALHVRRYTPYDGLGFGWKAPAAERPLPPDLAEVTRSLGRYQTRHTLERAPGIAAARLGQIRKDAMGGWRALLVPLAVAGAFVTGGAGLIADATAILNFLAYLLFAHPVNLTVYYVESYVILAFLAAVGVKRLFIGPDAGPGSIDLRRRSLAFAIVLASATAGAGDLYRYRIQFGLFSAPKARFEKALRAIPERSIVFVRYGPGGSFGSLVENGPDLPAQRVWIARDLGKDEDRNLMRVAPDRSAYLWDDARQRLTRLSR